MLESINQFILDKKKQEENFNTSHLIDFEDLRSDSKVLCLLTMHNHYFIPHAQTPGIPPILYLLGEEQKIIKGLFYIFGNFKYSIVTLVMVDK